MKKIEPRERPSDRTRFIYQIFKPRTGQFFTELKDLDKNDCCAILADLNQALYHVSKQIGKLDARG